MNSHRPWKALRTPPPFPAPTPVPERSGVRFLTPVPDPFPPGAPEYEVDLRELDAAPPTPEKSTWESRAMLALGLSKLGAFSKADADAVVAEAERVGLAFTRDQSHAVAFDGRDFTLTRVSPVARALLKLDSFLRRVAEPRK